MDKRIAYKKMRTCALDYRNNLMNNEYIFVYKYKQAEYIKTVFKKRHFLHFTGVDTDLSAKRFFDSLYHNKLKMEEFQLGKHTPLKLEVLPIIMNIDRLSSTIGEYNNLKPYLKADKIIGKNVSLLGFLERNSIFMPATVLKEDYRQLLNESSPIYAILKRKMNSRDLYIPTYANKKYDYLDVVNELPEEFITMIDMSEFENI